MFVFNSHANTMQKKKKLKTGCKNWNCMSTKISIQTLLSNRDSYLGCIYIYNNKNE